MINKLFFFFILSFAFFCACENDSSKEDNEKNVSDTTLEINRFIYEIMNYFYLWNNQMPKIDYTLQSAPKTYFYDLLYSEDYFSFITDDAEGLSNSMKGIETTFGFIITYAYTKDNRNIVGIVGYVYPNSVAEEAGLKRGDVIYSLNNEILTINNYQQLQHISSASIKYHRYNPDNDIETPFDDLSASLIARKQILNPVANFNVFDNHIGYLFYTNYYSFYNSNLTLVFDYFKEHNVTDLILDLRYNTGGEDKSISHLCSMIAPFDNVSASDIILIDKYNSNLQARNRHLCFDKDISVNLNLKRLVVLTSQNTYSASEATIIGLNPYMEVTCIGSRTGGKNTSMYCISPKSFFNSFSSNIDNWVVAPIVSKYYNAKNESFTDYIFPNFAINELNYVNMGEIGTTTEPLTQAAISYLTTGNISTTAVTCSSQNEYQFLETQSNSFDCLKARIIP